MESSLILSLQKMLSSDIARNIVGFCARWAIYCFIPFIVVARSSKLMRHAVLEAGWTALLAFTISTGLAALVGRVRPYLAIAGVEAIVPPNMQAGSFPSSHTAIAVGVAVALTFADARIGAAAIVLAVLVAFGRVASGMHFPTDVLGGAVIGVVAFILVRVIHQTLKGTGM